MRISTRISTTPASLDWREANQRILSAHLARVRAALELHIARARGRPVEDMIEEIQAQRPADARIAMEAPPALDVINRAFALSPFERDVLLLCAGIELESGFAALCAAAQGDPARPFPTFSLALAALPEGHWSALTPLAPLRRYHLIDLGPNGPLTTRPLRIDETMLHFLAGVPQLDERLAAIATPVATCGSLAPSHRALAERIVALWRRERDRETETAPLVLQVCGADASTTRAVLAHAAASLGLSLYVTPLAALPSRPDELLSLARLWARDALLHEALWAVEVAEHDVAVAEGASVSALNRIVERFPAPMAVCARERVVAASRRLVTLDVHTASATERRAVWAQALGTMAASLNGHVDQLASQFHLSPSAIGAACGEACGGSLDGDSAAGEALQDRLWEACRAQARPRLDDLAQRIETRVTWDDLALPAAQLVTLREIAIHLRQRATVYEAWGFEAKGSRGLGISALFAGVSGTGKTLAAEVLASELRLDLYRIDLSAVVSKYIGETEKNLRRIFEAAEAGGAILLFDEADALFGKRSEVKDSHDRYANIEVSYLLQRMEVYRGLAILTTNLKSALDTSFLRRIRFVVPFPFPDAALRAEIWRRIFPRATPTEGLDPYKLAQLNTAGGNIRNIALGAAFLAAEAGEPVRMRHLLQAARSEYAKLERSLTDGEIAGWLPLERDGAPTIAEPATPTA